MTYQEVKVLFNNEWIEKLCNDLTKPSDFINRNKVQVLETLLMAIRNSVDLSIPIFKEQRKAYLFVSDQIERELELRCYSA